MFVRRSFEYFFKITASGIRLHFPQNSYAYLLSVFDSSTIGHLIGYPWISNRNLTWQTFLSNNFDTCFLFIINIISS